MPGTQCKWEGVDGEAVTDFRTVVTGELHHVLLTHTLVGAGLPEQIASPQAFDAGLTRGLDPPDLLPRPSEVRASHALGSLAREEGSEFLSGLLIGSEGASMTGHASNDRAVTLVASSSLTARYQQAFSLAGFSASASSGDTAFQAGIRSIAHAVAK